MEEDLPRPQRPRTAGARLSRVRSEHPDYSRQRFDQDPVFLPHLRRQQHQPQPLPPPPRQPQQNPGLQRVPGMDRNAQAHTFGERIHPGDITSVEENDVSLSLHHTERAARGSQPHGEVKDKLRVVEVTGGKLEAAYVYRHYFQIHKHGGDVTDVKVDQENKVVFVTFVRHEVAQKVVQDEHMIGNQMVQVKLSDGTYSPPPDYYVDKLFFSNVAVDKDKEHLKFYFEKVSGCDPIEDQILYGDTKGDVLVTFQQPPDEEKTAANCRRWLLANRQVMVSRVSRSKCIIVENLNPKSTVDGIRNYFENPNRGGALVHDLKFSLDRRRCFVYFGSSEVAERIAERPHKLDDSPLRVKIYMECLGQSAGGFDPKDFYFPESFAVNGADPLICKFFRETKKVQCQWSKRFSTLHADVYFGITEKDPIVISCTLEKTHPKFRLLAERWKAEVDRTVADMLAAVSTGRVEVQPHSWADVENYIKGKVDLNTDKAILVPVEEQKTITVVGLSDKVDRNLKTVRKAVAKIEKSNMKRKKEPIKLESFEMNLLEKCGFFQTATRKFTDFKITKDTVRGIVLFEGTLIDIREAGWDMQKLLRTVSSRQITRLKDIQRALLDKDSTVQSIEASLQKEKVVAIWEKVKKEVKVYAFGEKAAQVTEKAICKQVSMEKCSLSAESTELLDTSRFKKTLQQLTNKHPGRLLIEPNAAEKKIVIAGYFARETRKQIEAYMLENTIYFETVSFSASRQAIISTEWREKLNTIQSEHRAYIVAISFGEEDRAITVKGTSRGLKEVRARLEQLGQEILCHVEQLTQPEKIKFLYSKKCQKQRNWIVHSNHCVISLEQEPAGLQIRESTRPPTPEPESEDIEEEEDEAMDENDDLSDDSSEEDAIIERASDKAVPKKKLTKPRRHRRPKAVLEQEEMAPEPEAESKGPQEARKSVHDRIAIMKADITDMPADAIVNAANSHLEHAGGLAKVIVQKGGQTIQDESRSIMRSRAKELDEGEVVPTGPGQLPCREIFHAVGPRYKDGRQGERERLALAVKNCLQLALDRGYQTIAIPALSTGIFRYPVEEASWVIVKAGKEFLENEPDSCLETVFFCDTSDDKVRHFRSAKEALLPSDRKGNPYDRQAVHAGTQANTYPERPATAKAGTRFPSVPPAVPDIFHQQPIMNAPQPPQAFPPGPTLPPGPPLQETGSTVPLTTIITLSVVMGEIAKQQVDAIVNSVARDADLSRGAVSRTLLQLAGPELQTEMKANYPQQLQFGDVAITSGHRLQCRHVLHVCLSDWSGQSSVQLLQQVMSKCLWEADQRGCGSIAFPALGTGNLKFPEAVVAQTMLQAVHHFEQAHPATGLRTVTLVIYPKDQHIFQAFEYVKAQGMINAPPGGIPAQVQNADWGRPALHPPVPHATGANQWNNMAPQPQAYPPGAPPQGTGSTVPLTTIITLSVVSGEIAQQQADAIVNSVARDADLSRGWVSRTLLQLAGPELQTEMKANYPQQLQFGDVAITSGHRLQCRHVLHVCLSDWSGQSSVQLLQQVMSKCLREADQRGCGSIAFPALGTGNLKFPEAVVAQTMLQAVHHFEQAHPATGLRMVTMVIYPRDQHIFQAFVNAKNQGGGGPLNPAPAPVIYGHAQPQMAPGNQQHPGSPVPVPTVPTERRQNRSFSANPDSELEARESKEYELLGVRIIVKQGRKKSESVDAVVVYSDPRQGGNYDNMEVLFANAAAHNGDWKKCLIHCLKEAADKKYKSMSLDSPVEKQKRLETHRFAEVLFSAVAEVHEDLQKTVREINVLFADERDITIFIMTMEKEGDKYNKANPVKGAADTWPPAKKPFEMCEHTTTLPNSVALYIYATQEKSIRQFREDFEAFVRDNFASETWKEQKLMKKNDHFIQKIKKAAKYKDVQLTMDRQKGTLTLHGFKDDVYQAKDDIKEIFRKAMQTEHEEEKKEIYANFAQWSYLQEEKDKGSKIVAYPKGQNSIIEQAFQAREKTVKIISSKGQTYVIDFDNMVEYPETNQKDTVSVLRQVKIHDKHEVQMPDTWSVHSQQELVKLVPVSPRSPEFTAVSGNFMATIGARQLTIVEITRIQNRTLYQQYQVKKMQMETQNQDVQNVQNEKLLWHGTAKDATDNINNHGFNRSYCGKNATVHGLGVYFAVNSDYSARKTYSPPEADGKRYMYQSRVLVGVPCSSDKDMRFLHARTGSVLYDSACDDVNTPGIYVIFHDTQAYPEYLVTFKDA